MTRLGCLAAFAAVLAGAATARADDRCVKLKARTPVYSKPADDARAGSARRSVAVFVDDESDGWLSAHAEVLEQLDADDRFTSASISFWIRGKDARRSRCPPSDTIAMLTVSGDSDALQWPDRSAAGWSASGHVQPVKGAKTTTLAGEPPLSCFDTDHFAGLRLHVCVKPGRSPDGPGSPQLP